jgi:putative DNA primase/helicase
VVAPPSMHSSGKRYEIDGLDGAKAFLRIAEIPGWLNERIGAAHRNGTRPESAPVGERWEPGQRNEKLASVAGSMRRRGCSREAIGAALLEENRRRCDPPLEEAEVRRIAESVARYEPAASNSRQPEATDAGSLVTRCLAEIESKPICWLWPGRIARGKLTIIAGNPGLGKSQITASIAAIVTTGGCWPVDRTKCAPGDVLFLTAEDDAADTLRPRLEAAGADLRRVHIIEGVIAGYTGEGTRRSRVFSLQDDVPRLSAKLAELRDVAAVIIDPISAYLGGRDSHVNAEVRGLLTPLSEVAAQHRRGIASQQIGRSGRHDASLRLAGVRCGGAGGLIGGAGPE